MPKTAVDFDARFATKDDCIACWIEARWGGAPTCVRCKASRVWTEREGRRFECADCAHQTSLTSGAVHVVDVIAPFGGVTEMVAEFREKVFEG